MVIGLKTPFFTLIHSPSSVVIRQFNTPTTLKLQLKSTNHIHFDCGQCQSDIKQCTPPLRLLMQIYFPFLSYLGYSSFQGNCNFHD